MYSYRRVIILKVLVCVCFCLLVCLFIICGQIAGPIAESIPDFWRMVWEQDANIVVMITGLIERGVVRNCKIIVPFRTINIIRWASTASLECLPLSLTMEMCLMCVHIHVV